MVVEISKNENVNLHLRHIASVARGFEHVAISSSVLQVVNESEKYLQAAIDAGMKIYGVTTGFGDSAVHILSPEEAIEHQANLIYSHSNTFGPIVSEDIVRAAMLGRIKCLSQGLSGVSMRPIELYTELLNRRMRPALRRFGSVGASGDLISLGYIALTAMGEGEVITKHGKINSSFSWLQMNDLEPLVLGPKEGLALINGTSYSSAIIALALFDLQYFLLLAISVGSLAAEALRAVSQAYSHFIQKAKRHFGGMYAAELVRAAIDKSRLTLDMCELRKGGGKEETTERDYMIQDVYSVRAIPQIAGPVLETLWIAVQTIEQEFNAVTDNPLIDPDSGEIYSGANFMGTFISSVADHMNANLAFFVNWMDRILQRMTNHFYSKGLSENLIENPRKFSGLRETTLGSGDMAAQLQHSAGPHLVTTRSVENHNQDIVSMSAAAGFTLSDSVVKAQYVLAHLMVTVAQALELRGLVQVGTYGKEFVRTMRDVVGVPYVSNDRDSLGINIELIRNSIRKRLFPLPRGFEDY